MVPLDRPLILQTVSFVYSSPGDHFLLQLLTSTVLYLSIALKPFGPIPGEIAMPAISHIALNPCSEVVLSKTFLCQCGG